MPPDGFTPPPAHRRLIRWFEASVASSPGQIALEVGDRSWTYTSLDRAANALGLALRSAGIGSGRRVGLGLPRGALLYLALLGIQKAGASYVPIDSLAPDSRRRWLGEDAALDLFIGAPPEGWVGQSWDAAAVERIASDGAAEGPKLDDVLESECYVLYTSGSTGLPKGVPISEANICSFIAAALPVYAVRHSDRVYQGVSFSFDFAIEEIWPTWAAGATLVASDQTPQPVGDELNALLQRAKVSILCAVPTVLATLQQSWPELRQLVVSGEACPAELVNRWARPGIRMLNAYGPTEITVSATIGTLEAGAPVTLGHGLPHLRLSVRDAALNPLPDGEIGELCIAGDGVAYRGYLNRPEQTAERFVTDPDGDDRMYRTGDLVSRTEDGRYLYFGRADDQIKLRGQRIEPGEIESALLADPAVAQAAVTVWSSPSRSSELAAYVCLRPGHCDDPAWRESVSRRLAADLPAAMRPSLFDVVADWPQLSNGKTDRRRLPAPSGFRLKTTAAECEDAPLGELGERIREIWRRTLAMDHIPAGAHFFNHVGGHSMTAAVTVSAIRRELEISRLAVADLYRHPRLNDFAAFCGSRVSAAKDIFTMPSSAAPRLPAWPCGLAQLGVILAMLAVWMWPGWMIVRGLGAYGASVAILLAALVMPVWTIVGSLLLPLLGHRLLGPLKPGRYPLWGRVFLKFWIKRKLLQMAPGRIVSGHRWWTAYLRLLGARIGRNGVIASGFIPTPELVSIGARVHIDADAGIVPYTIRHGWLILAPIAIGDDATIGCGAILQAGAVLSEGAFLAPQSALGAGDPTRPNWRHVGNPAKPTSVVDGGRYKSTNVTGCSPKVGLVPLLLLLLMPSLAVWPISLVLLSNIQSGSTLFWLSPLIGVGFAVSLAIFSASLVRLCMRRPLPRAIPLDSADYRRKWLADRVITLHQMLSHAVYDTVFTPPLLRGFGAKVGKGAELSTVSHFDPSSVILGDFCFVADLAVAGVPHHADGHMHVAPTKVGERAFVGNGAVLPAGASLADGVLLGALSCSESQAITTDCLGVPAFDLQQRERSAAETERLTFKPPLWRIIGRSAADVMRVSGPPTLFVLAYLIWFRFVANWRYEPVADFLLGVVLSFGLEISLVLACMAAKWLIVGRYRPRHAALWTNFVWRAQWMTGWYEAIALPALLESLCGTPWLAPFLRGFGCRIGRRVYLDTPFVTEFDLLRIEDDCEVGESSVLQTHLFEDRVMKCGIVHLERGASVGVRSIVLYGGTIGRHTRLESLSLAMKGDRLTDRMVFRGIPAEPVASLIDALPVQ